MRLFFTPRGWDDDQHWVTTDREALKRLNDVIRDVQRTPFNGLGKPEPLKGDLAGWWSRRITSEHRLVYRVTGKGPDDQRIGIVACRYHS